ncbi:MAG: hypothetical protein PHX54_07490, partial [Lentimicrobiaceae bacterium]|nr:hypothetical protein [Lentimicrobiaceae bacterium]
MKKKLSLSLILVGMILPLAMHAQEKFNAETLWKLGRLSDVQYSPADKSFIYGVTWYDAETNKSSRDIWRLDKNAESPRNLTQSPASEFNAIWRPDGKKIGFLSAESGEVQIWE